MKQVASFSFRKRLLVLSKRNDSFKHAAFVENDRRKQLIRAGGKRTNSDQWRINGLEDSVHFPADPIPIRRVTKLLMSSYANPHLSLSYFTSAQYSRPRSVSSTE